MRQGRHSQILLLLLAKKTQQGTREEECDELYQELLPASTVNDWLSGCGEYNNYWILLEKAELSNHFLKNFKELQQNCTGN